MTDETCKLPTCDGEPRDDAADAHARSFCSRRCELKYDHVRGDAEDARREAERQAEQERRAERAFETRHR